MADTKITALAAITTVDPAADVLPIVDISDTSMAASGTTKKITSNQILGAGGTATLASATITGDLTVHTSTLKVDSANNRVGIGTASPSTILHLQDASTLYQTIQTASGGAGTVYKRTGSTGATDWLVGHGAASASNKFEIYNGGLSGYEITSNGQLRYAISTTGVHTWSYVGGVAGDAMTLNSTGLLVGTTDTSSTSGAGFKIIGAGLGPYVVNAASTDAALAYTMYSTGAAAYRFYVGWGGTVFATNTTISAISDARLKENVQDIDVGLGAILALKPRKFDWKAGKGKDIKGDRGFIAQEFEQVFPQLVDEWKDAAPEGEAPYKSVRQDLIPVLVKAIQELTARVQTLETR